MSPTFLLECFWPGVTEAQFVAASTRASARTATKGLCYLDSILVPADEIVLFVVSGPSIEAVHADAERAGLRCDRVVESIRLPPVTPEPRGEA